ncbi:MAG: endonuclease III [Chlamydiales bacterium]|nr:endonuclease III [Chlamydiales bacterium]
MRKKRADLIGEILDDLFPNPPIPLQHTDAYTLLIAVLLSAQCTDARVNQVTNHLFAKASTPQEMILLTPQEIEEMIRPCGLGPTKSRAIWQLSHELINRYRGQVPKTLKSLETLPGVGHKTASVVLTQVFGKPAFPVDTHIHRCAKRWGLSEGKTVQQTEKDLKQLFPKKLWKLRHLQIIYFARKYCPAVKHSSATCPICSKILSIES